MERKQREKRNISRALFGTPTPLKTSGIVYSIAAVFPTIVSFIAVLALSLCGLMQEGYESAQWFIYFGFVLPQACFALVALWGLRYSGASLSDTVRSQKCSARYFVIALLMQVGLFAFSELNTLFLTFLENFGYTPTEMTLPNLDGFGYIGALIAIALLPAVFEEILFRGILLNGVKQFGTFIGALLCGVLFALYHQNPPQTIYQCICGTAFAFVALRAGSVLPTVCAHFFNNAMIITLYKCNIQTFSTPVYAAYIVVSALCFLVAIGWLIFDAKKTKRAVTEREEHGVKTFFSYAWVGIAVCALTWLLSLFTGM